MHIEEIKEIRSDLGLDFRNKTDGLRIATCLISGDCCMLFGRRRYFLEKKYLATEIVYIVSRRLGADC